MPWSRISRGNARPASNCTLRRMRKRFRVDLYLRWGTKVEQYEYGVRTTLDNNGNPPPIPRAVELLGQAERIRVGLGNAPLASRERGTWEEEAQLSTARDMSEGRSGLVVELGQNTLAGSIGIRGKGKKLIQKTRAWQTRSEGGARLQLRLLPAGKRTDRLAGGGTTARYYRYKDWNLEHKRTKRQSKRIRGGAEPRNRRRGKGSRP